MGKDYVQSYFALRTFTIEKDANDIPRICLNHRPIFQKGVLDQGYWPDGLYTPPCDNALIYDIKTMKSLGFNMLRKHIKIENDRWYYHCDRLGMIVWQDMVNSGSRYKSWFVTYLATFMSLFDISCSDNFNHLFARTSKKGRKEFIKETMQTIDTLSNHPSIAAWVIFNEGWGQFDSLRLTEKIHLADPGRLVDHASGWFDQGGGDVKSAHNYFRPLRVRTEQRPFILSEYGGYSCPVDGHLYSSNSFGYHTYKDTVEFTAAWQSLQKKIRELQGKGLAGAVYTQLSDVEEETNGLYTYDRKVCKVERK